MELVRPTGPLLEDYTIQTLTLACELPEALSCPVCLNALLDPVQCRNGHLQCRSCAAVCLAKEPVCPSCRVAMPPDDLTRPVALMRSQCIVRTRAKDSKRSRK